MANPTIERVNEYFTYRPESGEFIFKARSRDDFTSNRAYGRHLARVGKKAGATSSHGYQLLWVDGVLYYAHRIAWLITYGELPRYPDFEIDHINGSRSDNRILNLRKVTKQENVLNAGTPVDNKSGVKGVHWSKNEKKWKAEIGVGGKHVNLGTFETIEDAKICRENAERDFGFKAGSRLSHALNTMGGTSART